MGAHRSCIAALLLSLPVTGIDDDYGLRPVGGTLSVTLRPVTPAHDAFI